MTKVIKVTNVDDALIQGLWHLSNNGEVSESRVGKVLVAPGPVVTEYVQPYNRVLFNPLRDANPFFHLMESLWMLAGNNDVEFPAYYAKQIAAFSDDGVTLHGAYGCRWRRNLGYDQLQVIIDELKANPQSRRCVLQMWDADEIGSDDLHLAMSGGKDVPCNTHCYFDTIGGDLNMTVCCRSNDIVWGAYGANAVHFSILHEYVALASGIKQGVYRQFSNNYHMYIERDDVKRLLCEDGSPKPMFVKGYNDKKLHHTPLFGEQGSTQLDFDGDLEVFFNTRTAGIVLADAAVFKTKFFCGTVFNMVNAHRLFKDGWLTEALKEAANIESPDWCKASMEWLQRRVK